MPMLVPVGRAVELQAVGRAAGNACRSRENALAEEARMGMFANGTTASSNHGRVSGVTDTP